MCGIAGIYKFDRSTVDDTVLKAMTDVIHHRGPDGFDYWFEKNKTLAFGHRRLSIIDLSDAGKQPMSYMGLTITFNGEIYNYLEIKKELQLKGYSFLTESDTEVLLALYHLKGKKCLDELDGMFSFAIWDERNRELFCARDRFGEKPFYYYQNNSQFIFGSEIKQLFAAGIKKEVNPETLYNYCANDLLTHSYDLKQTFYEGIHQLPHSHYLIIKEGKDPIIEKYWTIDSTLQDRSISFKEAAGKFNHLLYESINRRLRSDVPVGTSLSGGLDSTTIAAYICRSNTAKKLNTFTASFAGFEKDETKFVSILKEQYTNIDDRYVSPVADDLIKDLDTFLYHQDEPLGSTSMYAQFRVMKLAKENNVTVLLDGQGSDEFMGGYNQYWPVRLREMFACRDKNYEAEKKAVKELNGFEQNIDSNLAFILRYPKTHKNISDIKKALGKSSTSTIINPLNRDFFEPVNFSKKNEVNWSNLNSVLNHSVFYDGLQDLLRYADRNSMAHSREVRLPFLYHKLVEFVFSLPSHYKMNKAWSKILLRTAQDPFLPKEICWRREKVGYATPQSYWMQNKQIVELQQGRRATLISSSFFDKKFIDKTDNWKVLNLYNLIK